MGKLVCVTGASGYIASWLVKLLLDRGYTVRGTVRDLGNPSKVGHLRSLEGAEERLQLYEAELIQQGSFDNIIYGCHAVFHTASPVLLESEDPQRQLIEPAVKGTVNVLESCKKSPSVKRVIITSSMASVVFNKNPLKADDVVDETWYSDPVFCEENKNFYALSKTLAEEAAWEFAKANGIEVVTLHPGFVVGPPLQLSLNLTSQAILNIIRGSHSAGVFRYVDVRDVALAHILASENPTAQGRYCLVGRVAHSSQVVHILKEAFPSLQLPDPLITVENTGPLYRVSQNKTQSLGLEFTDLEVSLKDMAENFKEKGLISL